ncbi:MAG: right-handed parallel beta-helix repeat-containing protein [Natrialbaceae archaeon]|nr:right-handed parallel beta-helix repeat-containing protein [Natrialbaceae archaeon]
MNINRRQVLKGSVATAGLGALGFVGTGSGQGPDVSRSADWGEQDPPVPYDDYNVHRVAKDGSGDYEEIQAAVNAAEEQDLILIEPGQYYENVRVNSPSKLTIRGTSRDEVIIDGEYSGYTGIEITADDVVVENLTVRRCTYGVYWTGVEGYRGSHLVANNCTGENSHGYGIYAFNSRYGRFEYCYASGSDDAGFYIGESQPADAVISDCIAENNAMGYSGTNAVAIWSSRIPSGATTCPG